MKVFIVNVLIVRREMPARLQLKIRHLEHRANLDTVEWCRRAVEEKFGKIKKVR